MNWNVRACGTCETGRGKPKGILLSDRDISSDLDPRYLDTPARAMHISGNGKLRTHITDLRYDLETKLDSSPHTKLKASAYTRPRSSADRSSGYILYKI